MARSRLTALAILAVAINAAFLTLPAGAQFGSIFGDAPPRPPGNVPRGNQQQLPPPDLGRGDLPPSQPQAPPMSLPPSSRPGAGAVQSQPLALSSTRQRCLQSPSAVSRWVLRQPVL